MDNREKKITKAQLVCELTEIRRRVFDLENSEAAYKQAETALKKDKEVLYALINATRETLVLIDAEGIIHVANDTLAQRIGKSVRELIGTCLYDYFPPDIAKHRKEQCDKVFITGKPVSSEDFRAGRLYLMHVFPVFNDNGGVSKVSIFATDITERMIAEELLKDEKERFSKILENDPCSIAVIGRDGTYRYVNPEFTRITGYTLIDIPTGRDWFEKAYPDPEYRKKVYKVWKGDVINDVGKGADSEFKITCKNGGQKDIEFRTTYLKDFSVTVMNDITARRQAESLLKESEERYRIITEKSTVGVYLIQGNKFQYVNDAFAQIHGYDPDEIIDRFGPLDFILPEDIPLIKEGAKKQLDGHIKGAHFEFKIKRKDGSIRHVEIFIARLMHKGAPAISGTLVDITERKEAEKRLAEERMRFLKLSENAPFGMVMIDIKGNFTYINPKFKELFGYDINDVPDGKTWFRKAYPNPDYRHKAISAWMNDLKETKTGESRPEIFNVICKNGTEKIVNFIPVLLGTGDTLMSCEDITERKRLEEQLHTMSIVDELTGLYNRRGFFTLSQQQFKLAERSRKGMALFFIDLDRMKWINDTLGHHDGDRALIEIADVLRKTFRETDIIGRIGGDEFAILAMDIQADIKPEIFLTRLQHHIDAFNRLKHRNYKLSLSVGIAHYNHEKPCSLDELISRADISMYEEKKNKQR